MEINDDYVIKLFFGNRQLKWQVYKKYIDGKFDQNIIDYLDNRFDDCNDYKEILARIKLHIEQHPVCKTCGKKLRFVSTSIGFGEFCSCKCAQNNDILRRKIHDTSIKKYGYGCNIEKMKQTCLIRYGVENAYQADCFKEKIRNTCIKKYGVDNYGKLQKHIDLLHSKSVIDKRNETKRKLHTFNTSKPEDESYILLKQYFNDVIHNYTSEYYPFQCDFYLPALDLYIECNYHWTHGGHPFNENSKEDIEKLHQLKNKNTKYYNNAINTWTIRDINKRNTAKQNNLNYIEFWKFAELETWLKNNFEKNT